MARVPPRSRPENYPKQRSTMQGSAIPILRPIHIWHLLRDHSLYKQYWIPATHQVAILPTIRRIAHRGPSIVGPTTSIVCNKCQYLKTMLA